MWRVGGGMWTVGERVRESAEGKKTGVFLSIQTNRLGK